MQGATLQLKIVSAVGRGGIWFSLCQKSQELYALFCWKWTIILEYYALRCLPWVSWAVFHFKNVFLLPIFFHLSLDFHKISAIIKTIHSFPLLSPAKLTPWLWEIPTLDIQIHFYYFFASFKWLAKVQLAVAPSNAPSVWWILIDKHSSSLLP